MISFSNIPVKQWIKAAIACLTYILFIAWVGNYWWLFLLPLIFDIYITKLVPWTFWKKTQNKTLYSICSWIDAIVFALIAVYFINMYLLQNYQIPSSSLEKTLYVGDYLVVSKAKYGPRVPMTPLAFPLAQHTMPFFGGKSYCDKPQWDYRRLAGYDTIQSLDIVVFNFPTGDTVIVNQPNPDYYTVCNAIGQDIFATQNRTNPDSMSYEEYYNLCNKYGRDYIKANPQKFGEIVVRPVDRRENYVKRCVGLPGDSLSIIDGRIHINGELQSTPNGVQYNYWLLTDGRDLSEVQFERMDVSVDDRNIVNNWANSDIIFEYLKFPRNAQGGFNKVYSLPLTAAAYKKALNLPNTVSLIREPKLYEQNMFPKSKAKPNWDRDNYGPIYIPRKGATTALNLDNLPFYERIIRNYEKNDLQVKDGIIYINGEIANSYTFKMNYYWMMGDNRHNSEDSRYWGYVPEDHIVGTPLFVWLSLDKDESFFNAIRWNRLFTWVSNEL